MVVTFEIGAAVRSKEVGSAPWFIARVESRHGDTYIVLDYSTQRRWMRTADELSPAEASK